MTEPLRIERVIDAPPDVVFETFLTDDGQAAFYGQDDPGWVLESDCDLRIGGVWTITFGPSRNRLYRHRHVFEVIDRPRRLVLATTESRPDGSNFDFTIEFTFEPQDARTLMTVTQSGLPTEELREEHGRGAQGVAARTGGGGLRRRARPARGPRSRDRRLPHCAGRDTTHLDDRDRRRVHRGHRDDRAPVAAEWKDQAVLNRFGHRRL